MFFRYEMIFSGLPFFIITFLFLSKRNNVGDVRKSYHEFSIINCFSSHPSIHDLGKYSFWDFHNSIPPKGYTPKITTIFWPSIELSVVSADNIVLAFSQLLQSGSLKKRIR